MMPEIKHIVVATRNPNPDNSKDVGSAEEAHFFVEGETVTLCSATGEPLRNADGHRIAHRLVPGENERVIASRMVLKAWRSERGDDANDFNRKIFYRENFVF